MKPAAGRDELPFDAKLVRHVLLQDNYVIAIESPLDKHGECAFSRYWWSDYTPGHPEGSHVPRWRAQGHYAKPDRFVTGATQYSPGGPLVMKSKKLQLPAKITDPILRAQIKAKLKKTRAIYAERNSLDKFLMVTTLPVIDELMAVVMAMSNAELNKKDWYDAGFGEEERFALCRLQGAHRGIRELAREIATEVYNELAVKKVSES